MMTVETKLARWRTLYGELCQAELRLREARSLDRSTTSMRELEQELQKLQHRCDSALEEVGAALAARRPRAASLAAHPV